jgi:hypothetical protein
VGLREEAAGKAPAAQAHAAARTADAAFELASSAGGSGRSRASTSPLREMPAAPLGRAWARLAICS